MRQLWSALALLAALSVSLLLLGQAIDTLTAPMLDELAQAAAAAEAEDWPNAEEITGRVRARWEGAEDWLRLVESHQTVGEIRGLLEEADAYAAAREPAEYAAANRKACRALNALAAGEGVTLGNLF